MKKLLLSSMVLILLAQIDIFSISGIQLIEGTRNLQQALVKDGYSLNRIAPAISILDGIYPFTQNPSTLESYLTSRGGFTQAQAVQIVAAYIKYMPKPIN